MKLFYLFLFVFGLEDEYEYAVSVLCLPIGIILWLIYGLRDNFFWGIFFLFYSLTLKLITEWILNKESFGTGDVIFLFIMALFLAEKVFYIILFACLISLTRICLLNEKKVPFISCLFLALIFFKFYLCLGENVL